MQRLPRISRPGLLSLGLTLAILQACGPTEPEAPVEPTKVQQGLAVFI